MYGKVLVSLAILVCWASVTSVAAGPLIRGRRPWVLLLLILVGAGILAAVVFSIFSPIVSMWRGI